MLFVSHRAVCSLTPTPGIAPVSCGSSRANFKKFQRSPHGWAPEVSIYIRTKVFLAIAPALQAALNSW